jgi:signal transduction histidine kinase
MIKKLVCLAVSIVSFQSIWAQSIGNSIAQQKVIDSLSNLLPQVNGQKKVAVLLALAQENHNSNFQTAITQAKEAVVLAEKVDKSSLPKLFSLLGLMYHNKVNNFDSAHFFYEKAKNTAIETSDKKNLVAALNDEGILFEDQNDFKNALANYLKALEISRTEKDTVGWMAALMNIGFVYKSQKDHKKAIQYFQESLDMSLIAHSAKREAENYYNLGMVYIDLKEYDRARSYLFKVVSFLDEKKNAKELGRLYHTIAISYQEENKTEKSIDYLNKAMILAEQYGTLKDKASSSIELGEYYRKIKQYPQALKYTQAGYDFAKKAHLQNKQKQALALLAEIYETTGNYPKAYQAQSERIIVMDSIFNETESRQRLEMIEKFETDKKQQENEILKAKTLLQDTEINKRNQTIWFIGLSLLAVAAFSVYLISENRKKTLLNEQLNAKQIEIEDKNKYLNELLTDKNNLINLVAHDLRAPFNKISGLTELIKLEEGLNDAQNEYIGLVKSVIRQGSHLIDDLLMVEKPEEKADDLHADVSVNGFINDLIKEFSSQAHIKNIQIKSQLLEKNIVIQSNKDHLQRILDNLLSNAIKFSPRNKNIYLEVFTASGYVNFVIRDEGPGFKEEDRGKVFNKFQRLSARPTGGEISTGLGLAIVKKLTQQLNGTVLLNSEPGKGAEFIVSIPETVKTEKTLVPTL